MHLTSFFVCGVYRFRNMLASFWPRIRLNDDSYGEDNHPAWEKLEAFYAGSQSNEHFLFQRLALSDCPSFCQPHGQELNNTHARARMITHDRSLLFFLSHLLLSLFESLSHQYRTLPRKVPPGMLSI